MTFEKQQQKSLRSSGAQRGKPSCYCLLFLAVTSGTALRAQVAGAVLSGKVTNQSGAAIANVDVTVRNGDNGQTRKGVSNKDGFYSVPNLTPGKYEVLFQNEGHVSVMQKALVLTVGAEITFNESMPDGRGETKVVASSPHAVQIALSALKSTVDATTVRELPLNGRDWASLAPLEPGVVSVPTQATTGFSANKGNRGFGDQLSDSGHRPNENTYRVNGIVINDYSNAAPGGATGVNLGVDAIDQFSVLTSNYPSKYGRTSGAVINAITKSGTNHVHGTAYFFDRDSIFDARNHFDGPGIPPFRKIQFGGSAGTPILKDKLFLFANYEGIRQNQPVSSTITVPNAGARAAAVPAIQPYLAFWPVAPGGSPDTNPGGVGVQSFNVSRASVDTENFLISRADVNLTSKDSLDATYFFDSGPQTQIERLGNATHQVFSRRQLYTAEETHVFSPSVVDTLRGGVSRAIGLINSPVSGDGVATNAALAIVPGAAASPQLSVSGLTTADGLGGFNKFNHAWTSIQVYDDAFIARGTQSYKVGFAFERMRYNVLGLLSPNGSMSTYSLANFLANKPQKLSAVAPNGSHEVGIRESLAAGYVQDDWHLRSNLTVNLGMRYEATTRPTDSSTIPSYTVNGYTVAAGGFQQITTLSNCQASTTACGPVGTDSPIASNPTKFDVQPRVGFAYDPFGTGTTAIRGAFGMYDVLPLPYEFGLNSVTTAPFQIIGADPAATLGSGTGNSHVNFNQQKVRNRYVQQDPKRAAVYTWNINAQRELGKGWSVQAAYVGSHSTHLSVSADDINLVPSTLVSGVGIVFPCDPTGGSCEANQSGTRIDSNWGGGAGIRPVLFDGTASYSALQSQIKKSPSHGMQGEFSYTFGHCNDTSSAPVTGDTFLNSIAVPLLTQRTARYGPCDFDIRQVGTGSFVWVIPVSGAHNSLVDAALRGWELGSIVNVETGTPFSVTVGGGNDPLGTGYNGDFSMDTADLLPNCKATGGKGVNFLNANCFTPPTAPASLALATAANPYGCAPGSFPNSPVAAPSGRQFCSNVVGNTGRNAFNGPKLVQVDMGLFKNTKIPALSEVFNVQFRAEFFNILNHTNYLAPGFLNTPGQNNSVYDFDGTPLPVALNQTSTSPRQIQLGAKLSF